MFGLILKLSLLAALFAMQNDCARNAQPEPKNAPVKAEIAGKSETNKSETNKSEIKNSVTKMENEETKNAPKLEAGITLNDKTLDVEYTVKNTTGKTIYLFNVLWDMNNDGKAFRAEQQLYVYLRDDKTLILAKHIPKLPAVRSVEFREIPYVTKIEAGKEFGEKISLPLPVEEFNSYFPKLPNSTTEQRKSETVVFVAQYIGEIDGLEIEKTAIDNAFSIWHRDLFGNVETLQTRPKPVYVPVNKRTDEFERY